MSSPAFPGPREGEEILEEGLRMHPGPWGSHSRHVAEAARIIAGSCGMDRERARVLGLLHDIGRREGAGHLRHVTAGYAYLDSLGLGGPARVCLTHSFPVPLIDCYSGEKDCTPEELSFLKNFLKENPFDDYDRLIQLCDCLADAGGFCLIEKRQIDVIRRYGTNSLTGEKIRAQLGLRDYFAGKAGGNLYDLLPGVRENSFR